MNIDLSGKRAIVSGSTAGIGLAIATGLAAAGAEVVVNGRTEERVQKAIETSGGTALAVGVDVLDEAALRRMLERAVERFGQVDCLVNNAGMLGPLRPLIETTDADVDRVFNLNVRAVYTCTRLVARHMIERGQGSIVSIASVAGKDGPRAVSYTHLTLPTILRV